MGGGHSPNTRAGFSYHLLLGPSFWECLHPRALPYTKNSFRKHTERSTINVANLDIIRRLVPPRRLSSCKSYSYTSKATVVRSLGHGHSKSIFNLETFLRNIPHKQKEFGIAKIKKFLLIKQLVDSHGKPWKNKPPNLT